ncbi:right-handed parallel beta-helix repeat-containing protein [uncultured Tateyamaria sp.]|uniref:right-handed parallel beta-helix repeat-containing protein n=1 Tax=Tateyamaria sp. 1078 TaxID=3417464 RepID=UPI00260E456C|nr:right-handed parallel beta-helix repeat-containing protein [uncultured Tateyamaria sp.]
MAVIHAAPSMRHYQRSATGGGWAYDLQTAVNKARPGDTVLLLPGRYHLPVTIALSGRDGAPITLRAEAPGSAILEGGARADAGRQGELTPLDNDFAMIRIFFADHIVLEGLAFENCWPTAIYMRAARHITVRRCTGVKSRFFAYARQQAPDHLTHHLTFEGCTWVQDADHLMWTGQFDWDEIKGNHQKTGPVKGRVAFDASYFNGAFFGCFDIAGKVIIRDCHISHAFNAIRMDMRRGGIGDGPNMDRNRDVAIYDNTFSFIRDNAIEPEKGAQNWRVFNNRFYAVHATISLDRVASRDVFIIGNTILNDHRPGFLNGAAEAQAGQGGRIFKFVRKSDAAPSPRQGLWSLYNSVQTRTSYAKASITAQWDDGYTMLGLFAADHPEQPGPPRAAFPKFNWTEGVRVFGMVTDDPTFDTYPAGNVSGHGVDQVFAVPVFAQGARDLSKPLGGWDGALVPVSAVPLSDPVSLSIDADKHDLPGGLKPGAQDVAALGLGHWRGDWPDPDAPAGV